MIALLASLVLAAPTGAHLTMWHPSEYGFFPNDLDSSMAVQPQSRLNFDQWWFHGFMNEPPAAGEFLDIPSGATLHGEIACNKAHTSWTGDHGSPPAMHMACDLSVDINSDYTAGAIHSRDRWGSTLDQLVDVKGSAIAIAWESDASKIQPEDFVVVSTNQSSPWYLQVSYSFPANLPPCPAGGCHCLWGWIASPGSGNPEMYTSYYRCTISNAASGASPLAKPTVARKCPYDKNNCTVGPKQPHYFMQNERNNCNQDAIDPPFYNDEYGFADGAQTDLWQTDDGHTWNTVELAPVAAATYDMAQLPAITPRSP